MNMLLYLFTAPVVLCSDWQINNAVHVQRGPRRLLWWLTVVCAKDTLPKLSSLISAKHLLPQLTENPPQIRSLSLRLGAPLKKPRQSLPFSLLLFGWRQWWVKNVCLAARWAAGLRHISILPNIPVQLLPILRMFTKDIGDNLFTYAQQHRHLTIWHVEQEAWQKAAFDPKMRTKNKSLKKGWFQNISK